MPANIRLSTCWVAVPTSRLVPICPAWQIWTGARPNLLGDSVRFFVSCFLYLYLVVMGFAEGLGLLAGRSKRLKEGHLMANMPDVGWTLGGHTES